VIKKAFEVKEVPTPNMRGGQGTGRQLQYFKAEEFSTPLAAFNVITMDPGVTVGFHKHEGSEEVYWILEGRAKVRDDDKVAELGPGDALLTLDQHSHSIENAGTSPLKLLAVLSNQVKK
jgi:mannose-6-phosphate isomerase-like protein (cupin superfamily)